MNDTDKESICLSCGSTGDGTVYSCSCGGDMVELTEANSADARGVVAGDVNEQWFREYYIWNDIDQVDGC